MTVIDLTDDPRIEMAMNRDITQSISAGIQAYRRRKLEAGIVGILQRGAVEGWKPEQTRQELLKLPDIISTQIGQEMIEAQTNTGRYYQHPLTREYMQSRIKATDALTEQREGASGNLKRLKELHAARKNIYDQYDTADNMGDEETKKKLKPQLDYIDRQIASLQGQAGTQSPVTGEDFDRIDVSKLPAATPTPQNKAYTDIAKELAKAQPAPGGELIGPPEPEGYIRPRYWAGKPSQAGEFTKELPTQTEPPSQEYFEQMVRQIARTDRAAAKAYYDKWVAKWQ